MWLHPESGGIWGQVLHSHIHSSLYQHLSAPHVAMRDLTPAIAPAIAVSPAPVELEGEREFPTPVLGAPEVRCHSHGPGRSSGHSSLLHPHAAPGRPSLPARPEADPGLPRS